MSKKQRPESKLPDDVRQKAFRWEQVTLADESMIEVAVVDDEDTEDGEQTVRLWIEDHSWRLSAMGALRLLTGLAADLASQIKGDNEMIV